MHYIQLFFAQTVSIPSLTQPSVGQSWKLLKTGAILNKLHFLMFFRFHFFSSTLLLMQEHTPALCRRRQNLGQLYSIVQPTDPTNVWSLETMPGIEVVATKVWATFQSCNKDLFGWLGQCTAGLTRCNSWNATHAFCYCSVPLLTGQCNVCLGYSCPGSCSNTNSQCLSRLLAAQVVHSAADKLKGEHGPMGQVIINVEEDWDPHSFCDKLQKEGDQCVNWLTI